MSHEEESKYRGWMNRKAGKIEVDGWMERNEANICLNISQRPVVIIAEVPDYVVSFTLPLSSLVHHLGCL